MIGVPFSTTSLDGIEVSWFCDGNGFFGKVLISILKQFKTWVYRISLINAVVYDIIV